MKIRVAIAEDNSFLAQSIKEKLELFPEDIELIFIASNGEELLELLDQSGPVDVVLMDIEMPRMDGIQATRFLREKHPQIKILMQTVFDDEQRIYDAVNAGAMGYLLKDEPPHKVIESIRAVVAGGASMSESVMAKSLELLRNPDRAKTSKSEDFGLTEREIDVLQQIRQGLEYREISANLFISPSTVRKHLENIYRKLDVNNKMQAVNKAIENKLI
ncbi:MAG: response regulator transcription factor [FCB group bacterium]|nr:response regulator transcription factor [FCB group bacterium]